MRFDCTKYSSENFYFLVKYENQALKWTKMLIYYCLKMTKNHAKPHQNPMGLGVQIPHPRGFKNQFPVEGGAGGGVQTLLVWRGL